MLTLITAARYISETDAHRYRSIGQCENKPHCGELSYDIQLHHQENRFSNLSLSVSGSAFNAGFDAPVENFGHHLGHWREGYYNSVGMICNNSDNDPDEESFSLRSEYGGLGGGLKTRKGELPITRVKQ